MQKGCPVIMNIRERKIELRQQIERARSGLDPAERAEKQQRINQALLRLCEEMLPMPKSSSDRKPALLTYMPFRSEVDVTPVMEWCWAQSVRVLLPRVLPETRSMALHEVRSYEDLASGAWGIREPKPELPVEPHLGDITMILVPGLAFDREFVRLGYGGGYYDRFMQLFAARGLHKPIAVAAAFDVQIVPQVPASWHDFRVDVLITETLHERR